MLLLDTNVISELRKAHTPRVDPAFRAWAQQLNWADLYLSAMTIYELEAGIAMVKKRDEPQAQILSTWLHDKVLTSFASRILPIDTAVATRAARLQGDRTREIGDTLIAATALTHDMTVVTRNVADFYDMGVAILNPWEVAYGKVGGR